MRPPPWIERRVTHIRQPSTRAARGLDAMNFTLADVRDGLGPYLGIWLITVHGWDAGGVGAVLAAAGIAGLLAKAPAGLLVDALPDKRAMLMGATIAITVACLLILVSPDWGVVATSQVFAGIAAAIVAPAIASLTLGLVGPAGFARRMGRNEAFNHAGNAATAAAAGLASLVVGPVAVFVILGLMAFAALLATVSIPAAEVDQRLARGLAPGQSAQGGWRELMGQRGLLVLAVSVAVFHCANAPMLPLVGQVMAIADPSRGTALMSACIVAAQVVMVGTSWLAGARADAWGRKALFLAGFAVLPLRGFLYTVSDDPFWLVGVQLLDGIGAGLFGVLLPLMVADLTRGSGHFGAVLGLLAVAQGLGASLGNALAGQVAARGSYDAAFLTLAGIAAAGAVFFAIAMRETRPRVPVTAATMRAG
ncbi:MFS transporter [Roseomonas fluvialis]|uniref:MFS transporter n=1 Tax=Roseomonas fluvialis TaxID=1750527 RepID=A0ABN6P5Y4_9PROT|nr:MFS transporter [Roseomonas fluvialis]